MVFTPGQKAFGFVLVLLVLILLFYTAYDKTAHQLKPENLVKALTFQDVTFSLRELNKVTALLGIGLLAFSFILGPLSHMFPHQFCPHLSARKWIGLWGFVFALLHSVYELLVIFKLDVNKLFFSPKSIGLIYGMVALFIFLVMAITSNQFSIQKLGFKNWKIIQTTGYVALLFAILHFLVLETKPEIGLDVRPFGLLFLVVPLLAIILRVGLPIVRYELEHSFHEHFGGHEETCPLPNPPANNSSASPDVLSRK